MILLRCSQLYLILFFPFGVTNLPELLARVLARDSLENFGPTGVLVDKVGHVVHGAVDDDVQAISGFGVVFGHFGRGECFGHFLGGWMLSNLGIQMEVYLWPCALRWDMRCFQEWECRCRLRNSEALRAEVIARSGSRLCKRFERGAKSTGRWWWCNLCATLVGDDWGQSV